jgi:hypothetical protein
VHFRHCDAQLMAADRVGRRPASAAQRLSAPKRTVVHYVQKESEKDEILHRYAAPASKRNAPSVGKRSKSADRGQQSQGATGASHQRPLDSLKGNLNDKESNFATKKSNKLIISAAYFLFLNKLIALMTMQCFHSKRLYDFHQACLYCS